MALVASVLDGDPGAYLFVGHLEAIASHAHRHDLLAQRWVGRTQHRRFGDGGMGHQPVLDLDRIDVLAAADDQITQPALEVQVAVGHAPEVTGGVPPLTIEGRLRGGLVGPVAEEDLRPPNPDLADVTVGHRGTARVADLDAGAGDGRADRTAVVTRDRRLQHGDGSGGLGHAVPDPQGGSDVRQSLGRAAHQVGRERSTSTTHGLERREVVVVQLGMIDQSKQLGGHDRP